MKIRIGDAAESVICPTITARAADEYREQIRLLAGFATHVHIDVADGSSTHAKLIHAKDIWWPGGVRADIHAMYKEPLRYMKELVGLKPRLIVVPAEANGSFAEFADLAQSNGVKVGVALKPETPVSRIRPVLGHIDHVLIVSGYLGYLGDYADTHLLTKVLNLKHLKSSLEIGWEGGINDKNIATLAAGGVDVFNVGRFVRHARDPQTAYRKLDAKLWSLPSVRK